MPLPEIRAIKGSAPVPKGGQQPPKFFPAQLLFCLEYFECLVTSIISLADGQALNLVTFNWHNGRPYIQIRRGPPFHPFSGFPKPFLIQCKAVFLDNTDSPADLKPPKGKRNPPLSLWTQSLVQAIQYGPVRGCDDPFRQQDLQGPQQRQDTTKLETQRATEEAVERRTGTINLHQGHAQGTAHNLQVRRARQLSPVRSAGANQGTRGIRMEASMDSNADAEDPETVPRATRGFGTASATHF